MDYMVSQLALDQRWLTLSVEMKNTELKIQHMEADLAAAIDKKAMLKLFGGLVDEEIRTKPYIERNQD